MTFTSTRRWPSGSRSASGSSAAWSGSAGSPSSSRCSCTCRAPRAEDGQAAREAARLRLEYYRARAAAGLSPMTEPLAPTAPTDQFETAIRGTPRARRDVMSLAFNVLMPLLLFLGVGLPLLI